MSNSVTEISTYKFRVMINGVSFTADDVGVFDICKVANVDRYRVQNPRTRFYCPNTGRELDGYEQPFKNCLDRKR